MLTISRIFLIIASLTLLLTACGDTATPTLAVAGQPTLVFVFTEP